MRHQTCRKTWDFVAACAKSTENCGIMPIQDPKAPKTNARPPSLKPNFSITEQELCKDTPLQKTFSRNYFPNADTEFRFFFRINFDYRNRISEFSNYFRNTFNAKGNMSGTKVCTGNFALPEPESRAECWETNFGRPNFAPEFSSRFFSLCFFQQKRPLKNSPPRNTPSKIQPRNRAKNSHCTSAGHFRGI